MWYVGKRWDHRSLSSTYLPCLISMLTFKIDINPSIAKNLCTYWVPKADRHQTEDPATTLLGRSITHDQKHENMPLEWSKEEHFCTWLTAESEPGIELIMSNTAHSTLLHLQEQCILRCACEWMGGWPVKNKSRTKGKYAKIQERKILSKIKGGLPVWANDQIISVHWYDSWEVQDCAQLPP